MQNTITKEKCNMNKEEFWKLFQKALDKEYSIGAMIIPPIMRRRKKKG